MQLLDELPMVWICCYTVYTMHTVILLSFKTTEEVPDKISQVSSEPGTGSIPAALLLSLYSLVFTLAYLFVPIYEVFFGMFATISSVMIIQVITQATKRMDVC